MTSAWRDTPDRYGRITRILHWTIALLLAWQFAGMLVKVIVGRHAVTAFMVGTHKPLGTLLMILIAARALWAFWQWRNRPRHPATFIGRAASAGHALLYALMLYIPAVALLREYGGTRAFAPWGIALFPERVQEIGWMVSLADASHSTLAWILLVVILGHIAMVALHHWRWRDNTVARMTGPL